eukprot:4515680-Pleurochrysis_carterae.AAC.1
MQHAPVAAHVERGENVIVLERLGQVFCALVFDSVPPHGTCSGDKITQSIAMRVRGIDAGISEQRRSMHATYTC